MSKAGKPSRPYRGGHKGRGGSHEKGGCLARTVTVAAAVAFFLGGIVAAVWSVA